MAFVPLPGRRTNLVGLSDLFWCSWGKDDGMTFLSVKYWLRLMPYLNPTSKGHACSPPIHSREITPPPGAQIVIHELGVFKQIHPLPTHDGAVSFA